MKPMLKAAFYSLVNDLLARDIQPSLNASTLTSYGSITWTDGDRIHVEELYSVRDCSPLTASVFRKRFKAWFEEIVSKHKEQTTAAPQSVASAPAHSEMTATAALQHMSYTLTGAIKQSQQPSFITAEAYADIKTNYELVATSCTDLATVVWLRNHLCFGYSGDEHTFEEINLGYRDHIDFILKSGWRPGTAPAHRMVLSNMFELDWWDPQQIVITSYTADTVTGTATMTDTEGEYQFAFEWNMVMGEKAEQYNLPFMVYITAARFTLPYEFSLFEYDGSPLDTLTALQEMDCTLGFCNEYFTDVYQQYAPAEGAINRG